MFVLICFLFLSLSKASSFGSVPAGVSRSSLQHLRINTADKINNTLLTRGGSDGNSVDATIDVPKGTKLTATAKSEDGSADLGPSSVVSDDVTPSTTALSATGGDNSQDGSVSSSNMGPNAAPPGILRKLFPSFLWHTLPNLLTYARCLAIPALVIQFYTSTHVDKNIHSSLIFAIASITDYLDGYLARRWDICSPFGAFLDPVADKLMVSTALILLTGKYGYLVAIPSSIILAREIAVSALREWMASKGKRDSVKVGFQGKVKTAATMVALTIMMSIPDTIGKAWNIRQIASSCSIVSWNCVMSLAMFLLFLSASVTVTSGSVYFKAAAPVLMGKE